ncbi:hypothetical protein Tsubulata_039019 [Turnera subulata]|uniref:caffeate O-methyltransferase n=1 Tax=Turnera subulata TaxID=218843 RepID=A0A9Q0GE29_9ROSI|nr:hypothetical protein Tsubulata_039019 [Turnera subulata]
MAASTETPPRTTKADEEQEEETFSFAVQIAMGSVFPMVMQAAIELGIFDIIARAGPDAKLSASEIAAQLPTKNPEAPTMLDRILRLLTSHCVLGCSLESDAQGIQHRLYSLVSVSKYFVRDLDGVSLGPLMISSQDKVFMDSWPLLKDAVLEGGIPFNKVHGKHAFDHHGADPRFNQLFNSSMFNHTTIVMRKVLDAYKGFEHIKQLVDVGGNQGVALNMITSKYPHIEGINFDLPSVIQQAPPYPGVEHISGDMFVKVPEGDAIFMKWILHDWSDEHCLRLLKNCYEATPGDGKVIVMDAIVPVMPENSAAARETSLMDVFMMTQNPGGKERTQQEFLALATGAGFSGIRFECRVCNFWVMEFFK